MTKLIRLSLLAAAALLSVGCVSGPAPRPDVLPELTMVGDGWYVAGVNLDRRIMVQTKKLPSTQVTHHHFYENGIILQSFAHMKRWGMRFVNTGPDAVCVKLNILQVDYDVGIFRKWHVIAPMSTEYVGDITQHPFFTMEKIMAYDEAKWVISDVLVVNYTDDTGCKFEELTEE